MIMILVSSHAEGLQEPRPTPCPESPRHIPTTALADTGCQSCLAGPDLMSKLHLGPKDLIPVNLTMKSASGNNLPILRAALLASQKSHLARKTRQMVYFSPEASQIYLSMATLADLGHDPKRLPVRIIAHQRQQAQPQRRPDLPDHSTDTTSRETLKEGVWRRCKSPKYRYHAPKEATGSQPTPD